jgi:transposase
MSYIVEQKIKGKIYLYKVESYWDKGKKQSRQKRSYIGPKNPKNKAIVVSKSSNVIHKNYGNVFLLNRIIEKLGLHEIVKEIFPDIVNEIFSLAYYDISESNPYYLFPYWHEENYLPETKKMDSSAISKLCDRLGRDQQQRFDFQEKWIDKLKPVNALYYDITSISSYSTNIDMIEWGYNRDHDNLAQLNIGMVFCNKSSLPIFYLVYPGSIVDVKTLKNCVKYLKTLKLENFMFILDRGFFSTANIAELNSPQNNIDFIQPLSFSLKKAKELIKTNKKALHEVNQIFTFNNDVLSHVKSEITLNDKEFPCYLFLNSKAELDQKHTFIKKIIDIEQNVIKNKIFSSLKQVKEFKQENIIKEYQSYFKWNKSTLHLERNQKTINSKIAKFGYFIIMTNKKELDKCEIISNYRNKDIVEKVFDLLKNEMDGDRLRVHSQYNADAKIFIKFIGLIIQSEILKTMKKNKLFKHYSARELLFELKKIKRTETKEQKIISEISKKQRLILEAFNISEEQIHSY